MRKWPEPSIENYRRVLARAVLENDFIYYLAAGVLAYNLKLVNQND